MAPTTLRFRKTLQNSVRQERLVEKNTSVTLETVFDAVEDNNSTWTLHRLVTRMRPERLLQPRM